MLIRFEEEAGTTGLGVVVRVGDGAGVDGVTIGVGDTD